MKLKRILTAALAAACAASLLVPAAYAHGCHSRARGCGRSARYAGVQAAACPACGVDGCTVQGWHVHDGAACGSHHHGDTACDGDCVPLCAVEDCHETGRHTHDGLTCCGAVHDGGWCDGSCLAPADPPAVQTAAPAWSGHHGGHHGGCR